MRVLIAGLGDHKEFGLRSLREAGHFVGIIDLPHRVPIDHCDWWRAGDRFSVESVYAEASSADFTWDAILCWEELSVDIAREVALKLGVPAPRMPLGNFRDKGIMHGALRSAGVPTPQLGVARSAQECAELADGRFPIVVKPTDYGGSGGVKVVYDPGELEASYHAALEASPGKERVAVDRYVTGREFSVESVTWAPGDTQIIAITEKHLTRPPYCIELGHVSRATVSEADHELLVRATVRALDALGMEAGVSHAEFRMSDEGPLLMEVAGRPAGDQIPRLIELATGWNLNTAELAAVVGERTTPAARAVECAAIRFFVGDGRSPFHFPVTVDNASEPPFRGVLHELCYFTGEGGVAPEPRGPEHRLGYAMFAGSRAEVLTALDVLDGGAEVYRGE